jgi:aldose sugar dehydrogenase
MKNKIRLLLIFSLFSIHSCQKESPEDLQEAPQLKSETILTGYQIIWGMDFLPGGDLIFGEKRGKLYRKINETVTEISGFPKVLSSGQGGLLDIKVHPDYSNNGWIYASYSARKPEGGGELRLIRFKITSSQVQNIETIFTTNGTNTWYGHYGSRIVFDENNFLFLSVGEGGSSSYGGPNANNRNALNPKSDWGKIHRLNDDGSIPADNPVIKGNDSQTSIYSFGHRNPQGLAFHPETGELWQTEHGPKGGDEINIIFEGLNYGWPDYSIGLNYDGSNISAGHTAEGITAPVHSWTPSPGICGMAFITSDKFGNWKGNLLVSGLVSQKVHRCVIDGDKIIEEQPLLSGTGRVRNVVQAPDGSIYVSVENPGRIIQITP